MQKLPEARKFCTEQVMRQRAKKEHGFTSRAVFPVADIEKPHFHCIPRPGKNGTSKGSVFTG